MCSKVWLTRQDFVCDPCLSIDGYQLNHENIDHGLFLFTHRIQGCGGSMALLSLDFFDLIFSYESEKTAAIEKEKCPLLNSKNNFPERCQHMCEWVFSRKVLSFLRQQK